MNKILCRVALISAAVFAPCLAAESTTPDRYTSPVVATSEGKLQGHTSKGVYEFLGIHYGASTAGTRRFKAPAKPASWQGIRKADSLGNRCPQPDLNMTGEFGDVLDFDDAPVSEDCLVLNLWTPAVADGGKRPVMVWLHGGGFSVGSGNDNYYHGSNLARGNDVVVINLNHRLNGFGFLSLGEQAGPAYASSGLVGMLDIVHALQWVRDNISKFGGDPDNVTIFGQSGGGGKVSILMAMPAAKNLFHKAIVQSGAFIKAKSAAEGQLTSQALFDHLGIGSSDVKALQGIPMADLITANAKVGLLSFYPAVDGKLLPDHPFDPVASPLQTQVPVMVGYTKDEGTTALISNPGLLAMTEEDLKKQVAALVPSGQVESLISLYRNNAPNDKPVYIWSRISTDMGFGRNSILLAERKAAEKKAPVYLYIVNWESPVHEGKLRATHAVEIPFVFDTVYSANGLVGNGQEQEFMAKAMSQSFAAFARNGDPNTLGLPEWPRYTVEKRNTMIFDVEPEVVADPGREKRLFWQEIHDAKTQ